MNLRALISKAAIVALLCGAAHAGGVARTADYKQVSSSRTGHAESVEITYDPQQIKLGQLLQIYFSVAHDPTQPYIVYNDMPKVEALQQMYPSLYRSDPVLVNAL